MKYELVMTSRFRKDLKRMVKRGLPLNELEQVLDWLSDGIVLGPKYRDHELSGNYAGFRECHIRPDWLLIYMVEEEKLILTATRTGSHSDLL
ncbi:MULTISPECIES: type II toxin-antitoxin system YafQ family toxin [Acidaminococcus]|jgi:mRNA interferase YafQ|uniref:type II toxin-antitoxin system YafQ family toxin n=1 Tax=Negativicutes TaxID=909932 RepID=UPI002058F1FC|nr:MULTISPECIES: type II toxin-antitoxin system YafQ family toxin [Acidaminococcus]MCI7194280.1 type II toxin-antitoxin system YafQ family toxin [Acidaminococcus fermentans]DAL16546.1 MAG TPA_asm: bacterial toxin [Caudoviricetes sp.]